MKYPTLRSPRTLLTALLLLWLSGCNSGPDYSESMQAAVTGMGYTHVMPPTTLTPPGTVVWVRQTAPFASGVVCAKDNALGASFELQEAPTLSAQWQQKASGGLKLGADFTQQINAELGTDYLRDVQISLANARVLEVVDSEVLDHAASHDPTAGCLEAIALRKERGDTLTMVRSVLQADVSYTLHFAAGVSAEAKATATEKVSGHLSGSANRTEDSQITAQGLYVGILDDALLLKGFLRHNPTAGTAGGLTGTGPQSGSTRALPPQIRLGWTDSD